MKRNNIYGGVVVPECAGCNRSEEHFGITWCMLYPNPGMWSRLGGCPFNHKVEVVKERTRIGQQKHIKGA